MNTTLDQIREELSELLAINPDTVTPEARLIEDLGLDSLDRVEFAMEIENHYDIDISDEQWEAAKTVQDLINTIDATIAAKFNPNA